MTTEIRPQFYEAEKNNKIARRTTSLHKITFNEDILYPTGHFKISEPQSLSIYEFYEVHKRQSTDSADWRLWNIRSGTDFDAF